MTQVIQQAIEAELAELLSGCANVVTLHGKRAVVRNGYLPQREVLAAAGKIAVKAPKVRDRSGSGIKFNSNIVPPYIRKSPRVSAALPWLHLKGISKGDMEDDASGLSANVVSRLKAQWVGGNGAIVGAGSVATMPVPSFAVAVGNPALVIGYRDGFGPKRWWQIFKRALP